MSTSASASWDTEYARGRYQNEPPVGFTADIISAAKSRNLRRGLYIGCGNGRNFAPMNVAGLDLIGLDICAQAIVQLRQRRPHDQLIVGDLGAVGPLARFDLVVGLQVFQHGTRGEAHAHLSAAADRVAPGGLLCVRVNATATDLRARHERIESAADGSFTVRYLDGPKSGLSIHFFTEPELTALTGASFNPVLDLRLDSTLHQPPALGQWSQWEAIWQKEG